MINLYTIGPVSGIKNDNLPAFEHVREALWGQGSIGYVVIPHDVIAPGTPWKKAMRISIQKMLTFDGVAMLDGWEKSKGAVIEHDLAVALGIPCKPWREWLQPAASGAKLAASTASQAIFAPAC